MGGAHKQHQQVTCDLIHACLHPIVRVALVRRCDMFLINFQSHPTRFDRCDHAVNRRNISISTPSSQPRNKHFTASLCMTFPSPKKNTHTCTCTTTRKDHNNIFNHVTGVGPRIGDCVCAFVYRLWSGDVPTHVHTPSTHDIPVCPSFWMRVRVRVQDCVRAKDDDRKEIARYDIKKRSREEGKKIVQCQQSSHR